MAIEENKIHEIYKESKDKLNLIFDQFKLVRYPTGVSQIEPLETPTGDESVQNEVEELIQKPREYSPVDNEDAGESLINRTKQILLSRQNSRKASISISSIRVLDEQMV